MKTIAIRTTIITISFMAGTIDISLPVLLAAVLIVNFVLAFADKWRLSTMIEYAAFAVLMLVSGREFGANENIHTGAALFCVYVVSFCFFAVVQVAASANNCLKAKMHEKT